jgi:hypothetical protein
METITIYKKKLRSIPKEWVGLSVVILLADVIAIYLMIKYGRSSNNDELTKLGYETIKLSIQLFLVVLVGGIIIQKYNRSRARKDAVNEFKRATLKDLSRAYSEVKGVRRIIRAKCEPIPGAHTKNSVPIKVYDEHIATINKTQLELEILGRELRIIKEVFNGTDKLRSYIENMEKYLGEIISEYETKVKNHIGAVSIPLSELPRLRKFIAKIENEESDFAKFANGYRDALIIIQDERLKVA